MTCFHASFTGSARALAGANDPPQIHGRSLDPAPIDGVLVKNIGMRPICPGFLGPDNCRLSDGMSSDTAMKKHSGGVAEYRSSEGKTVRVPYRGAVVHTCNDIMGGIRSTCTYVGAKELRELAKRTTFIRVTQQLNQVFGEAQKLPPPVQGAATS